MIRVLLALAFSAFLMTASGLEAQGKTGGDSSGAALAEELTRQGWLILNTDSQYRTWRASSSDAPPYFQKVCDRPEATLDFFRRAVALNPKLAQAWRGWGRALEEQGLCPMYGGSRNWAQFKSLEPIAINPQKIIILPYRTSSARALAQAEEKFRQAIAASPTDYQAWLNLGFNLMNQAHHQDEDQGERRRLLEEGLATVQKGWDLNPKDVLTWGQWRQLLLRAVKQESDPTRWPDLLDLAWSTVDRQVELWPETGNVEEHGSRADIWPNNELTAIFEAFHDFLMNGMFEEDLDKARALNQRALALKERELGQRETNPVDLMEIGDLHLALARTMTEEKNWQQALSKAEETFSQYLQIPEHGDLSSVYGYWQKAAQREDKPERQLILVGKALKLLDDGRAYECLGYFEQEQLKNYPEPVREMVARSLFQFDLAARLPNSPARQELTREAEVNLDRALSLTEKDQQSVLWQRWARSLFALARKERDPEAFEDLLKRSDEKYRRALETADKPGQIWKDWGDELARPVWERDPDRRIRFLEAALEKYQQASGYVQPDPPGPGAWGDIYYQMGWLRQKKSATGWPWYRKALTQYALAIEEEERDKWPSQVVGDATFKMGLKVYALAGQYSPAQTQRQVNRAMRIFRRYFEALPADSEYSNRGYYPPIPGESQGEDEYLRHSFQDDLTRTIAEKMLDILQVNYSDKPPSWRLKALAGLHRHLAWSGMLTPEYRRLYLQRTESYLRQSLDSPDYGPFTAKEQEERRTAQVISMSELGLALAEWTLIEKDDSARRLKEAEELWQQAGKLRPGSDRYARARWAARLNDRASLLKNLRHTRGEMVRALFPAFEDAVDDPAFADVKDEGWFRQNWYGFD